MAACLAVLVVFAGCATTSRSVRFTQSEVKRIPEVSFRTLLAPDATGRTVTVRAAGVEGAAVVRGFEGRGEVIVADAGGRERKVPTREITGIEIVWPTAARDASPKKGGQGTGEAVGEGLLYAPLVPVAVAAWPFLRASGLDARKNATDDLKAMLVYGGLSREDLEAYVGEPRERYSCEPEGHRGRGEEIWVYPKDRVLRGGRALFIGPDTGAVYHGSHDTSFFKKWGRCSLLTP